MDSILFDENVPIELIHISFDKDKHDLFIKREDLIHPYVSGNKWRKLKYCFEQLAILGLDGVVTYGGAFSNHLIATAKMCELKGISCILNIRGDELNESSNDYLKFCYQTGAKLQFIDRNEYKNIKNTDGVIVINNKKFLSIPEGGAGSLGVKGAMEIVSKEMNYDVIALAAGTTTTTLGILLSSFPKSEVWCFPVLKGFNVLKEIESLAFRSGLEKPWLENKSRLHVFDAYHFGGYAKTNAVLDSFILEINGINAFKIEKVYTAKALYGLLEQLKNLDKRKVLFIHTGGVLNL